MCYRHLEHELDDNNVTVLTFPVLSRNTSSEAEAINHTSVVVLTL